MTLQSHELQSLQLISFTTLPLPPPKKLKTCSQSSGVFLDQHTVLLSVLLLTMCRAPLCPFPPFPQADPLGFIFNTVSSGSLTDIFWGQVPPGAVLMEGRGWHRGGWHCQWQPVFGSHACP